MMGTSCYKIVGQDVDWKDQQVFTWRKTVPFLHSIIAVPRSVSTVLLHDSWFFNPIQSEVVFLSLCHNALLPALFSLETCEIRCIKSVAK